MNITELMHGQERTNDKSPALRSESFRMKPGFFGLTLLGFYGRGWILVFVVLFVAASVAGIVADWRWFMTGIMFLLIIIPGVVALVYYSAALRPECYINLPEHTLTIVPGGVEVGLSERKIFIPLAGNEPRNVRGDGTILRIVSEGKKWKGFLWIPVSAFTDEEAYTGFVRALRGDLNEIISTTNQ